MSKDSVTTQSTKACSKESVTSTSTNRASVLAARELIDEKTKKVWQAAFQELDLKHTGKIDVAELTAAMTRMQMVPQPGEVHAMIEAVDLDHDGEVSYDEFELMLVSAGRGRPAGFAHIVDRFIRMPDVTNMIARECKSFADEFMKANVEFFKDLDDSNFAEKRQTWLDVYRKFLVESELFMQNALIAWGVNTQYRFEDTFLEAAQNNPLLDSFLKSTEYEAFMKEMTYYAQKQRDGVVVNGTPDDYSRPGTADTQDRLQVIDKELANLDAKRNALLAERRRLIGFEVTPLATAALKHELDMMKWKDDVGMD